MENDFEKGMKYVAEKIRNLYWLIDDDEDFTIEVLKLCGELTKK